MVMKESWGFELLAVASLRVSIVYGYLQLVFLAHGSFPATVRGYRIPAAQTSPAVEFVSLNSCRTTGLPHHNFCHMTHIILFGSKNRQLWSFKRLWVCS